MNADQSLLALAHSLAEMAVLPLDPPAPPPSVDGWFNPWACSKGDLCACIGERVAANLRRQGCEFWRGERV